MISIIAFLTVNVLTSIGLLPVNNAIRDAALGIGALACFFILLHIYWASDSQSKTDTPIGSSEARQIISAWISQELKRPSKRTLVVTIVTGFNLEPLDGVLDAIYQHRRQRPGRRMRVRLAHIDPEYTRSLFWESARNSDATASILNSAEASIGRLVASSSDWLSIDTVGYESLPTHWGIAVGKKTAIWGIYSGQDEALGLDGGSSPCFLLNSREGTTRLITRWIETQFNLANAVDTRSLTLMSGTAFEPSMVRQINEHAFDKLASRYDEYGESHMPTMAEQLDIAFEDVHEIKTRRVLELGCATGYMTRLLAKRVGHVTGIDFSHNMTEIARSKCPENAFVLEDEFLRHDFGGTTFDIITAVAFVHLFPRSETRALLRKTGTLLAPGGFLYLTTTNDNVSEEAFVLKGGPFGRQVRFRRRFTFDELWAELESADFTVEKAWQSEDALEGSGKPWMALLARPAPVPESSG